jgi:hypothetical protein
VLYLLHQNKHNAITQKVKALQINTCRYGAFPTMIEELEHQDESPHVSMSETGGRIILLGQQGICLWQQQDIGRA